MQISGWFLNDRDLRHERIKAHIWKFYFHRHDNILCSIVVAERVYCCVGRFLNQKGEYAYRSFIKNKRIDLSYQLFSFIDLLN